MFARITVFVLLISFVAQSMNRSVILIDYMFNTASFEKNCINKAKPKLNCHGKCQLSKQIREQEEKDKTQQVNASKADLVLSSKSFYATAPAAFNALMVKKYTQFDPGNPVHRSFEIFHPPA
jgi:uncharacterized membrane protein YhiD involved in acid resistance